MDDQTKTFGQSAESAMTNAAASPTPSTTASTTSTGNSRQYEAELEHKRAFLETFRRWEVLFKRKDGEAAAAKWLVAEYFESLGHLSAGGFKALTRELKERCIFFPTIRECLEITSPGPYDYASPFCKAPAMFQGPSSALPPRLTGRDTPSLTYEGEA